MGREDIQRKIGELNRQINEEVSKTTLPDFKPKPFPTGYWALALAAAAWWLFGADIPKISEFHDDYGQYGMYVAAIIGLAALIKTALWLFKGKPKGSAEYMEATARVRALQEQRRELEMQLKELDAD